MMKNKYSEDFNNFDDDDCPRRKQAYKRDRKTFADQYRNRSIRDIVKNTDQCEYYNEGCVEDDI